MAHNYNDNGTVYEISGGKINMNGTVYEVDHGKANDSGTIYNLPFGPAIITFTYTFYGNLIGTFQAEEGMTWRQFINSAYNVGNVFSILYGEVVYYHPPYDAHYTVSYNKVAVYPDRTIIAGAAYAT